MISKCLARGMEELEIGGRTETIHSSFCPVFSSQGCYHTQKDKSIGKIGQNIVKSPGDLRRLALTQILVKDHQSLKKKNFF